MSARHALAQLLTPAAGGVPVLQAPLRQAAPPLFAIAPGQPYQRPNSSIPGCVDDWRLDVWCITTREDVAAMDTQDAMAATVQAAVDGVAGVDDSGYLFAYLGVERANVDTTDLAGMPGLATIVQLRVSA